MREFTFINKETGEKKVIMVKGGLNLLQQRETAKKLFGGEVSYVVSFYDR